MRRFAGLAFLLLCFAAPGLAQTTIVSGQVVDPNNIPYSGATIKAQLTLNGVNVTGQPVVTNSNQAQCISAGMGNAPCKIPFQGTYGPATLDAQGNIPGGGMTLQDNSLVTPASTQWTFSVVESPGIAPPAGTGPQSFSVAITISGSTQTISSALSTAAPALSNITTFNQGAAVIDPVACCGVKADGHAVADASTTNTSQIVTCPNLDCKFNTTAKVSQRVYAGKGFNACTGGAYIIPASTTITSIDSDSQIHVSNPATATCTATARLVWGDVDQNSTGTGPWQTAWNLFIAASTTGVAFLKIPCAMSLVDAGVGGGAGASNAIYVGAVAGCGPSTSAIELTANYNWTAVSIGALHTQFFQLPNGSSFVAQPWTHDFVIDGSGENTNCPASAQTLLNLSNQSFTAQNVYVNNVCPNNGNLLPIQLGSTSYYINIQSDFAGQPCMGLTAGGQPTNLYQLFCGDSNQGMAITGTGIVNSYGSSYGSAGGCGQGLPIGNGGNVTFNSYGDKITSTANINGGTLNAYGDTLTATNCGAGNGTVTFSGSSGTANLHNNTSITATGTTQTDFVGTGTVNIDPSDAVTPGTVGIAPATITLGITPQSVGTDVQTAKTTAQVAKTLFTVGSLTTLFRASISVECTTTSASATVTPAILYTDTSGTVQTVTGSAATCTALGAASVTSQDVTFRAKNATAIQYQTTIANTPTYDVSVNVEQLGIN